MEQITPSVSTPASPSFQSDPNGMAEIQQLLNAYFDGARAGELDQVMSYMSPDIVAFDMPPVFQFKSRDEYEKAWQKWFIQAFCFPVTYEPGEQEIRVNGDLGLVFGTMHVAGTFKNGEAMSCWLRHTIGLHRVAGRWAIVHQHISVPVAEDGRAMMDLTPKDTRVLM